MTGWNDHGHAAPTGLPIDHHLGAGELQDAENCGYAPVALLAELGVDYGHGDAQVQFRDGCIVLLDGTVLERGGTLNCVWAVARLPDARPSLSTDHPTEGVLMSDLSPAALTDTEHLCVYTDGVCRLAGIHGGVPDPDPADANLDDFRVMAYDGGDLGLSCAHWGRGCWWMANDVDGALGALLDAARVHLAAEHRRVDEGGPGRP